MAIRKIRKTDGALVCIFRNGEEVEPKISGKTWEWTVQEGDVEFQFIYPQQGWSDRYNPSSRMYEIQMGDQNHLNPDWLVNAYNREQDYTLVFMDRWCSHGEPLEVHLEKARKASIK